MWADNLGPEQDRLVETQTVSTRVATPPVTKDPAAWLAADMHANTDWRIDLTDAHRDEVARAVEASCNHAIPEITRESFDLPQLGPVLEQARRDVVDGRGFVLIRGLPIAGRERDWVMRAWFGIGAWFGIARPQNGLGHLVGHVKDLGEDKADPKTRLYRTNARQRFHVDSCDIVGLLCLQPSRSGGASSLCSSVAVVDEIARIRPGLADVLRRPFIYDRKNEIPQGKGPYYEIPIVHDHAGLTTVYFARDFIESAQARFPEIPRLTEAQVEALGLMERLAASDRFRFDMAFRPGDMQFVHNHALLHSRTAYEDWAEPERRRHLLRLWLSAHDPRALPPVFEERYGPIRPGLPRGGVCSQHVAPTVPFEAE